MNSVTPNWTTSSDVVQFNSRSHNLHFGLCLRRFFIPLPQDTLYWMNIQNRHAISIVNITVRVLVLDEWPQHPGTTPENTFEHSCSSTQTKNSRAKKRDETQDFPTMLCEARYVRQLWSSGVRMKCFVTDGKEPGQYPRVYVSKIVATQWSLVERRAVEALHHEPSRSTNYKSGEPANIV